MILWNNNWFIFEVFNQSAPVLLGCMKYRQVRPNWSKLFHISAGDRVSGGQPCVRVLENSPSSRLHGVLLLQRDQSGPDPDKGQTRGDPGRTLHIQVVCTPKWMQAKETHPALQKRRYVIVSPLVSFQTWLKSIQIHSGCLVLTVKIAK